MKQSKKMYAQLSVLALAAMLSACGGGGSGGSTRPSVDGALSALPNAQSVLAGTGFTYTFTGSSDLTYTASLSNGAPLPAGLTFDPVTRTITGTSALDLSADLIIRITASNGVDSTSDTFTLAAVPQGVFRYRQSETPGSTPLVYGIVFPKTNGVAEMWSWEYLSSGVTLWSGDVSYPSNTFSASSEQRSYASGSYIASNNIAVSAVKSGDGMTFTVNGNAYDAARLEDAWPAVSAMPAAYSDWAGSWRATAEMSSGVNISITHDWTVDAEGRITGQKLNGAEQACVVAAGSRIELTGTPVSRVHVTYTCTDGTSGDYSGISFNRQSGEVGGKIVLLKKLDAVTPIFNSLAFLRPAS